MNVNWGSGLNRLFPFLIIFGQYDVEYFASIAFSQYFSLFFPVRYYM